MTTPRTVAGQAAISGMRPFVKRALVQTILSIEAEAVAPYLAALCEADRVLESLAGADVAAPWDLGGARLTARPSRARRSAYRRGRTRVIAFGHGRCTLAP